MTSSTIPHQVGELGRLSASMKKLEKELKDGEKHHVCTSLSYQADCLNAFM
jgi:hypothetical protein